MKSPTQNKPLVVERHGNEWVAYIGRPPSSLCDDAYMHGQEAAGSIKRKLIDAWEWSVGFFHYVIGRRL